MGEREQDELRSKTKSQAIDMAAIIIEQLDVLVKILRLLNSLDKKESHD